MYRRVFLNEIAGRKLKPCNFIRKETSALKSPGDFCESFKNNYLPNTTWQLVLFSFFLIALGCYKKPAKISVATFHRIHETQETQTAAYLLRISQALCHKNLDEDNMH